MQHTYFVGYDAREHEAALVCALSIRPRKEDRVYMLEHRALRRLGLFTRPWQIDKTGQFYDVHDGRPFSTEFSHSRFLVFHIARRLGLTGPCMFVDCDWLFVEPPERLMKEQAKHPDKIGVVNRNRMVDEGSTKMDGMVQENYDRKLWSALFTFMPSEEFELKFNPPAVNANTGRALHSFCRLPGYRFWSIDPKWHYIPSLDPFDGDPWGIHFSEFSPWLNPDRRGDAPGAFDEWSLAYERALSAAATAGSTSLWHNLERDYRAAQVDKAKATA